MDKDKKNEKKELLHEMRQWAYEWLKEKRAVKPADLDAALAAQFPADAVKHGNKLKGKDRTAFENLCDWVKARLTSERATMTECGYILWIPLLGHVGAYSLASYTDVRAALRAMKDNKAQKRETRPDRLLTAYVPLDQ